MYSQPWSVKSGLQANSKWPGEARCAGGSCRKACEAGAPVDGVCDGGHLCQAHHVLQAQVLDVGLAHADELAQHRHTCAAAMLNFFLNVQMSSSPVKEVARDGMYQRAEMADLACALRQRMPEAGLHHALRPVQCCYASGINT